MGVINHRSLTTNLAVFGASMATFPPENDLVRVVKLADRIEPRIGVKL